MTHRTTDQSITLRRLARYLQAAGVKAKLAGSGQLIAAFHAIGDTFHFHIDRRGAVIARGCEGQTINDEALDRLCVLAETDGLTRLGGTPPALQLVK